MSTKYVDLDALSHFKAKADNEYVKKDGAKVLSDNNYTDAEKTKLAGLNNYDDTEIQAAVSQLESDVGDKVDKETGKGLSTNDYTTTEKNKLSNIEAGAEVNTIETVKVNGAALTPDGNKAVDIAVPTNNNQLTNGAGYQTESQVNSAIDAKLGSTYKPAGSVTFANLPALSSTNEGKVYNVTNSFTTTSDFVEGAGKTYPAGTNVVIVNVSGSTYKYDVLSGFVDLSGYVQTSDLIPITNAEIDTIFDN